MESAGTQAFLRFCDSVTSLGLFRVKRKKEKTIWSKKIKMVSGNWDLVPPLPVTCFIILVYSPGPSVFCLFVCCCCLFDWFAFVNMKWGQFTLLRKGNIDLNSCMYVTYWEREGKINRGCMLWSSTQVWFSVCVCVHFCLSQFTVFLYSSRN